MLSDEKRPVRTAIVGAGPAGFYAADALFRAEGRPVSVDLYDLLPTPHGLVRAGVAPDHQKIKNVSARFEKTADTPGFRFFGNVVLGEDVQVDELLSWYDQVVLCTGAQADRRLGIPGEDLPGSHSATEFVAWYNGHPDFRDRTFDLSAPGVAIIGVGNVAVDVARILSRGMDELRTTDMADHALTALADSKVQEVHMLGRRGPAQAAFTIPEAKELGELPAADLIILPEEAALDALSQEDLDAAPDRLTSRKVEMLQTFAGRSPDARPRRLHIRFLVSPIEIIERAGRVGGVRIVRNELFRENGGRLRPRPTDRTEILDVGIVFRSVGYRGVPVAGVPFDERSGTVPNRDGRVVTLDGELVDGLYVAGWIKRGPSGVIGTNKACAQHTVAAMIEDLRSSGAPSKPEPDEIALRVGRRRPDYITLSDWRAINTLEVSRGESEGRPRRKMTTRAEILEALGRAPT